MTDVVSTGHLDRESLLRRLNPHLATLFDFDDTSELRLRGWHDLLTPRRFDIAAKLVYAKARLNGASTDWERSLYLEHLRVWSGFREGDGSGKDSSGKFLAAFDIVIDSVAAGGFDSTRSLLPVDLHGALVDGAHRAAACIASRQDAVVVEVPDPGRDYSSDFFRAQGLAEEYLDAMAIMYAEIRDECRVVCLFPVALDHRDVAESLIGEYGTIVHRKAVEFYGHGPQNLLAQLYRDEPWLGSREAGWPGAKQHLAKRFVAGQPVVFFLVQFDDPAMARSLKERFRAACGKGNEALHINDTHEETVRLSGQLFNENSIDLFNRGDLSASRRTLELHHCFRRQLEDNGFDNERVCVDGSSVMALYGLRDGQDFDYLCEGAPLDFSDALINCHNDAADWHAWKIGELISNPRLFLRYDGVKYVSLGVLRAMKLRRGERKDLRDVELIDALGKPVPSHNFRELRGAPDLGKRLLRVARRVVPVSLRRPMNYLVERARDLPRVFRRIPDYLVSEPTITYRGYHVAFVAGDKAVDALRGGGMFEPEMTRALLRLLQQQPVDASLLAVGAGIGIVPLNVLSLLPSTRIHLLPLLPEAVRCMSSTIARNGLQDAMLLHDGGAGAALTGPATPSVDDWWRQNEQCRVDVVHYDGTEDPLAVLTGARSLLVGCRPQLVLSLKGVVDPDALDAFLRDLRYALTTFAGTSIEYGELKSFARDHDHVIAMQPGATRCH